MISIHTRITVRDRNYLDSEIKKGTFASYGHALRALLHYYRVMSRENSKLRSENARMKGMMEVIKSGELPESFTVPVMGALASTKKG
ncbi:hypothetical protein LCGC14_1079260 [marine sediment metagenome]|uniref:Uncharacterized protein n=1 Tax=marine sediment metagenome TaxID=412755 RepID=A0A0F9QLJ5_9ZZZZ